MYFRNCDVLGMIEVRWEERVVLNFIVMGFVSFVKWFGVYCKVLGDLFL